MRIVHITTDIKGGAGLAALRLHKTMLNNGLNSILYNKFHTNAKLNCHKVTVVKEKNFFIKIKNFIINRLNQFVSLCYDKLNLEFHSGLKTQYRIDEYIKESDVLIIHWVAEFLDYKSFFYHIDKDIKVFFYVHDFNIILGRMHTLFDNNKPKNLLIKWIEKYYKSKKKSLYKNIKNLNIVANSNFTLTAIRSANYFSEEIVSKVYLGIPRDELTSINKSIAKKFMGFEEKDFLILISSNEIEVERKGYDRFVEILKVFKNHPTVKFVSLGKVRNTKLLSDPNFFNFVTWNPIDKSNIFSGVDVMLSTSYEETFGQTVIESYACSTPVIVFNGKSALPEIVEHKKTGFIANSNEDVINYINMLVKDPNLQNKMGKLARETFVNKFTSDIQLREFRKLIEN